VVAAREIASSEALQKTIFFNTWFSISWFICTIVILARKVGSIDFPRRVRSRTCAIEMDHALKSVQYMKGLSLVDPDEVRTIFLVLFMIFEPLRLTAGYYGNLKEQVLTCLANV
jgi:hypothetical protein